MPGDYVYTFKVSSGGSDAALNPTFEITFTLTDPCDPPVSVTSAGLTSQTYTITDTELQYQFTEFAVVPSFCPVDYTSQETTFNNDNGQATNAVTLSQSAERTYLVEYSADLSPVGVGQTVTLTATSTSIYGVTNTVKT